MSDIHAMVLAAGASRRLGQPKQLVTVGGRPLIARLIEQLVSCDISAITVVVGANADAVRAACQAFSVAMVMNEQWPEGIASSIRCGVQALPKQASILIAVCDQWRLTATDYQRLVRAHQQQPGRIAAAQYAGTFGVPAVFPPQHRPSLSALAGDQGARGLIEDAVAVAMPSAASDLDLPEQLADIQRG